MYEVEPRHLALKFLSCFLFMCLECKDLELSIIAKNIKSKWYETHPFSK